jgi:hypothetical protein
MRLLTIFPQKGNFIKILKTALAIGRFSRDYSCSLGGLVNNHSGKVWGFLSIFTFLFTLTTAANIPASGNGDLGFIEFIKTMPFSKEAFADFQSKIIGETGELELTWDYHNSSYLKLGLYGTDLSQIGLWFVEYGLDWVIYRSLNKTNIEHITDALLEKHVQLLEFFSALKHDKNGRVLDDKHAKGLCLFLSKECSIDLNIRKILTSPTFLKIIAYLFFAESITVVKNMVFPSEINFETMRTLLKGTPCNKPYNDWYSSGNNYSHTLTLSTIIKLLACCTFGFSSFITMGLGLSSEALSCIIRNNDSRPKFFDSHFFSVAKHLVGIFYFSRKLNDMYQNLWTSFVWRNADKFKVLLDDYKTAQQQHDTSKVDTTKKELAKLVAQAHKTSFFEWIKAKQLTLITSNTLIETVIAVPFLWSILKNFFKPLLV